MPWLGKFISLILVRLATTSYKSFIGTSPVQVIFVSEKYVVPFIDQFCWISLDILPKTLNRNMYVDKGHINVLAVINKTCIWPSHKIILKKVFLIFRAKMLILSTLSNNQTYFGAMLTTYCIHAILIISLSTCFLMYDFSGREILSLRGQPIVLKNNWFSSQ